MTNQKNIFWNLKDIEKQLIKKLEKKSSDSDDSIVTANKDADKAIDDFKAELLSDKQDTLKVVKKDAEVESKIFEKEYSEKEHQLEGQFKSGIKKAVDVVFNEIF